MGVLRTAEDRFDDLEDYAFEPRYVDIQDETHGTLRMHYVEEGLSAGPVILLLHGQATWAYMYRKMITALTAHGFRVIAPDFIGFGRSDKLDRDDDYTYQSHVDWLGQFISLLDIQNATGCLFDWGGMFGLRVAVDRPQTFARLALLNTTLPRGNKLMSSLWVLGWRRYIKRQPDFPISKMVSNMTHGDVSDAVMTGYEAPYPDEDHKAGPRKLPWLIPASPWHEASGPNSKAWEKLVNYDKPVLTIYAQQCVDRGPKPKEFIEGIAGAQGQPHTSIPNTGFFVIEDAPEEVTQTLLSFINATS